MSGRRRQRAARSVFLHLAVLLFLVVVAFLLREAPSFGGPIAATGLAVALGGWILEDEKHLDACDRADDAEHRARQAERLLQACAQELAPPATQRERAFAASLADNLPPRDKP